MFPFLLQIHSPAIYHFFFFFFSVSFFVSLFFNFLVSFFASDSLPVNLSLGFVQKGNKIIKEPFTFALPPSQAEPCGYFEIETELQKAYELAQALFQP